jgi:hypothetical protein
MVTAEERLKILQMIQEGKLTPEQGMALLDTLGDSSGKKAAPLPPMAQDPTVPLGAGKGPRWVRVRVTDTNTGKTRVNIRLPVTVVTAGFKLGARFSPEVEGLDNNQLMELIRAGEVGKIVDVLDDEDGEHVEVYLE